MVDTVVFDFGAVLFRWEPVQLLQQVLAHRVADDAAADLLKNRFFQSFEPGGDWSEFDRGSVGEPELARRIAARLGFEPHEVQAVIDAVPPHLEPQAETVALLERLHAQGMRLLFLSNMPAPYADYLDANHAFLKRFEGGVYSAHVGVVKPEPAIFELMTRRFGLAPARTLFIDDHPANVAAARAFGWQAVQFTDAASCAANLQAAGALRG